MVQCGFQHAPKESKLLQASKDSEDVSEILESQKAIEVAQNDEMRRLNDIEYMQRLHSKNLSDQEENPTIKELPKYK